MSSRLRLTPSLKAGAGAMLDAIEDAADLLEADPTDASARRRSFGDGLWGIPVRDRTDDWLVIWEHDSDDSELIVVRYLGTDPFARRRTYGGPRRASA
jgi:hypothetical protein